jgi:hypothetical protein
VACEAGASIYNPPGAPPEDRARNKITNLHRAPLASLEELPPRSGPTK